MSIAGIEIVCVFPKLRFLHLQFKSNRYIYSNNQITQKQFILTIQNQQDNAQGVNWVKYHKL